jgi:hypothetical protein
MADYAALIRPTGYGPRAENVCQSGNTGSEPRAVKVTRLTQSRRWMFGRIYGFDGQESYRELRLELLYCLTV